LNHILPGRNYGWPVIGYGVQYGGTPIHLAREREGMEQPLQYWTPSIAPSGLMLYTGNAFPSWRGNIFVGGLSGLELHRIPLIKMDSGYQVGRLERPSLLQGFGRIRDVRQGLDGYIYLAMDDRQGGELTSIVRLQPIYE
jgi:glucose/arabinose dehydrogenase